MGADQNSKWIHYDGLMLLVDPIYPDRRRPGSDTGTSSFKEGLPVRKEAAKPMYPIPIPYAVKFNNVIVPL